MKILGDVPILLCQGLSEHFPRAKIMVQRRSGICLCLNFQNYCNFQILVSVHDLERRERPFVRISSGIFCYMLQKFKKFYML